jgi:hypothetical protein
MIVFKSIDEYSQTTGNWSGSKRVYDHQICDFTGEKIPDWQNPNTYMVDYNDNDPCFGDGPNEGWLLKDYGKYLHYELFSQRNYIFLTSETGEEAFWLMYQDYVDEMEETPLSLDFLLRWARGRMLEKVIKDGKYKIQDFLEEDEGI